MSATEAFSLPLAPPELCFDKDEFVKVKTPNNITILCILFLYCISYAILLEILFRR